MIPTKDYVRSPQEARKHGETFIDYHASATPIACLLWLIQSDFRPYVYDPVQIELWISGDGFEKRFEDQTATWLTQVYVGS